MEGAPKFDHKDEDIIEKATRKAAQEHGLNPELPIETLRDLLNDIGRDERDLDEIEEENKNKEGGK